MYAFLNDKHLYHRQDSQSWKKIISIFSEHYQWKVFDAPSYKQFILDDGGFSYGKEITENIFTDFSDLFSDFPKASRFIYPELENADYASHAWWAKNLYLSYCVFTECENIYFRIAGLTH